MTRVLPPPRPMITIALQVPSAVFYGLQDLAHQAGYPRDLYASNLLIAAYSARRGPTGDAALDEAIARLNVKPPAQLNENANAEIDPPRAEISKAVPGDFVSAFCRVPDPTNGLPDCTRRMIVALNAAGIRPQEIARDTDTPLDVVKAVLGHRHQAMKRGR